MACICFVCFLDKPVCITLRCRPSWLPSPGMPSPHKLLAHHLPASPCSWGSCQLPSSNYFCSLLLPSHTQCLFVSSHLAALSSHLLPLSYLFIIFLFLYQDALSIPPFLYEGCFVSLTSLSFAPFHSLLPWGLGRELKCLSRKW